MKSENEIFLAKEFPTLKTYYLKYKESFYWQIYKNEKEVAAYLPNCKLLQFDNNCPPMFAAELKELYDFLNELK